MKKTLFILTITLTILSCTTQPKEKVLYMELVPQEFRERLAEAPIAYLPLGTLEWHGEHLPLGSDGLQPYGFFQEIAAEVGGIVLPPLFLGPDRIKNINGEDYIGMDWGSELKAGRNYKTQKLAGSAYWVPDSVFNLIMDNIIKQLSRQGFKILVAHGHGPSTVHVINNTEKWEEKYGIKIIHLWGSPDDEWKGFMCDHAAMTETSLVMKYRPKLVQMYRIPADTSIWPVGIGGKDPRVYASPEKGQEIVDFHKEILTKKLKDELAKIQ